MKASIFELYEEVSIASRRERRLEYLRDWLNLGHAVERDGNFGKSGAFSHAIQSSYMKV